MDVRKPSPTIVAKQATPFYEIYATVEGVSPDQYSDQLRQLGLQCVDLISKDSVKFRSAAEWLSAINLNWEGPDRDITDWVIPPKEYRRVRTGREMLEGSVVRSLKQAWADATYRFHSRTNDRYYDFGTDDARRLILLGALTFNRDFTGELLGLEMPWERPSNAQAKFEGRADLWLIMTAGEYAESTLIRVLQVALEHYAQCERTTPSIRPDLRAWQAPNRSGRRVEIKEDLIRRHRKGEEYLNQAAYARQYRCSPATVNKAFKDDVGLTAWMKLAVESRRSNSSPAKTSGYEQHGAK